MTGLYFGISMIVREAISLFQDLPELYQQWELQCDILMGRLEGFSNLIPEGVQGIFNTATNQIGTYITGLISNTLSSNSLSS